ncbi:hypothetical protein FPSE_02536 [Fusarium pseudograminearum CS3096]|uniref:Uncharacterized protein n=1 Tax=Fusarium pseudograminearum (strain CS3096) TaxID=1028729 RepID=K3UX68_FUSPC|nr:hypothetical protein FPSE_02536 [Fusarium pseudograminearum CS3096]EKJ77261.1 hypothetical protein FPSE_02536 [Fusarium pseudograminearum CS3096]
MSYYQRHHRYAVISRINHAVVACSGDFANSWVAEKGRVPVSGHSCYAKTFEGPVQMSRAISFEVIIWQGQSARTSGVARDGTPDETLRSQELLIFNDESLVAEPVPRALGEKPACMGLPSNQLPCSPSDKSHRHQTRALSLVKDLAGSESRDDKVHVSDTCSGKQTQRLAQELAGGGDPSSCSKVALCPSFVSVSVRGNGTRDSQ